MDPDMVRQQEEAEEEARRLKLGVAAPVMAAVAPQPPQPPQAAPSRTPAVEPVAPMLHAHVPGLPPVIPIPRKKKRPVDTRPRIGWYAALRVSIYALIMTALGLLGGIMIGVKLGLAPSQSLGIGAGLGFLLGWQSAFASLRANKTISFLWAMLISMWPALIVLAALIAAMVAGSYFTGMDGNAVAGAQIRDFWIIVGAGAATALLVSTLRTRKLTLR